MMDNDIRWTEYGGEIPSMIRHLLARASHPFATDSARNFSVTVIKGPQLNEVSYTS